LPECLPLVSAFAVEIIDLGTRNLAGGSDGGPRLALLWIRIW